MKITVGFDAILGVGEPQTIETSDGTPIAIDGLGLALSVRGGVLEIRVDSRSHGYPVVRPVSGNVLEVRLSNPTEWEPKP